MLVYHYPGDYLFIYFFVHPMERKWLILDFTQSGKFSRPMQVIRQFLYVKLALTGSLTSLATSTKEVITIDPMANRSPITMLLQPHYILSILSDPLNGKSFL